jgi:hypothetical protein
MTHMETQCKSVHKSGYECVLDANHRGLCDADLFETKLRWFPVTVKL